MPAFKRKIVAGLDVGSSKIFLILAEVYEAKINDIIGVAKTESKGIRQGTIIDIDKTANSIKKVIAEAERMAGIKIDSVYVSITGSHISSMNKHKVISIKGENKEVSSNDVKRVTDAEQLVSIPSNKEIIHILPSEFIIDNCRGIKSPVGMAGRILEAESHIVTADTSSLQNLKKSLSQAGLAVESIVLQSLANSLAVLTKSEKDLGVVLVDIGAGTTDIAIFKDGNIKYTAVLEIGGNNITASLAKQFKISRNDAERLKREYGSTKTSISAINNIKFVTENGQEIDIAEKKVAEIIEQEMVEIFSFIKKQIIRLNYKDLLPAGVVLTGGEALIPGLNQTVESMLKMPVRTGVPNRFDNLVSYFVGEDRIKNHKKGVIFSTGLGLIEYAVENRDYKKVARKNKRNLKQNRLVDKLKQLIASFF